MALIVILIVLSLADILRCVSDGASMTLYRHCVYTYVILFLQISPTSKISRVFLHVAAGIADDRGMIKQPIMIRTVVVCPVTGVYRVVWQPLRIPPLYPDPVLDLFGFSLS